MKGSLFILKRHELDLAELEAKAAVHGWGFWNHKEKHQDGTILFEIVGKIEGLGLTRRILDVIEITKDIKKCLSDIDWDSILNGKSYKVVVTKFAESNIRSLDIADIIWESQKKPLVDLDNPEKVIEIVVTSVDTYVTLKKWESSEEFSSRRAHSWPAPHPSAMHPSVARALVNISCSKHVHDPFCGAGGFLIEGGMAGIKISGSDISEEMVARAVKNTAHFGLKPVITVADATKDIPKVEAIVTDLPYGRSTRSSDGLVEEFLECTSGKTNRIVLGLNEELSAKWNIKSHVKSYVHRSVTRHFYVLDVL